MLERANFSNRNIIIRELSGNIIIRETIRNHKRIITDNIRHGARRASVRVEVVFKPNCVIKQVKHSFLFLISVSEIYKYTDELLGPFYCNRKQIQN